MFPASLLTAHKLATDKKKPLGYNSERCFLGCSNSATEKATIQRANITEQVLNG